MNNVVLVTEKDINEEELLCIERDSSLKLSEQHEISLKTEPKKNEKSK